MKMYKTAILCIVLMLALGFSGCGSDNSSSTSGYDLSYSGRDLDSSYKETKATAITLSDEKISINGDGASADGSTLTIREEGTYIISGSLSDGQIIVNTPDDEKVQIVLKDADIACSDDSPILIKASDKVFITLSENSENILTGPSAYNSTASNDSVDGVIFSKADLCINGSGSLKVTAAVQNGIVSKDDLIITGGSFNITAAGDGIQGKDCVKVKDGSITINAENDGIKSNNSEDEYRGFLSIDGGTFTINAGYDGLQAETLLRVADGSFDINTGGGSEYSSTESDWGQSWGGGGNGQAPGDEMMPGSGSSSDSSSTDTVSAKGLKGNLKVLVLGGTMNIDSSDDSIHSNGDVQIRGGKITLSSGDDGIHADSDLIVKKGKITIAKSYEGLEGNTITVKEGTIDITASDDGLNASGGNDGSSTDGRAGQDQFAADETAFIEISGGTLNIDASGDGVDSNGALTVTGGTLYVSGPANDGNGALDYNGQSSIKSGTVVMTGSSGMAQNFGDGSTQCSLLYGFSSSQAADSQVSLVDSSGNTIASYSPNKSYTCVLFSCDKMKQNETYTICVNGTSAGTVTLSSIVTSSGISSSTGGGMPGGGAPKGGL
ncbi:MAG: carbohydrate-binding domain-containing protein [Clostridiales bacterium]|nr:carbohydrate-binding domain-containing protein [Clostridiales bacterium]